MFIKYLNKILTSALAFLHTCNVLTNNVISLSTYLWRLFCPGLYMPSLATVYFLHSLFFSSLILNEK